MSNVTILLLAGCLVLANFYLFPLLLSVTITVLPWEPARLGRRGETIKLGDFSLSLSLDSWQDLNDNNTDVLSSPDVLTHSFS